MKISSIWQQPNKHQVAVSIALLVALISVVGLWMSNHEKTSDRQVNPNEQTAQAQTAVSNQASNPIDQPEQSSAATTTQQKNKSRNQQENSEVNFQGLQLEAESVIIWDIRNKRPIYTHNAEAEQPLASLTKLMTALVATQEYTRNATTTINSRHLDAHGEYGLAKNEVWTLDQLISFMLIESANDAARAVSTVGKQGKAEEGYSKQFVEMMNETATSLDLTDTYFFNPSGLDINEDLISGGYGTARDIARLFVYIQKLYPDILQSTRNATTTLSTEGGNLYTAKNTNKLVGELARVTGSKTGYTVLAGGNLVMGFNLQRPVVIAVLGSTKDGRFTDMKKLYKSTQQYFNENSVDGNNAPVTKSDN